MSYYHVRGSSLEPSVLAIGLSAHALEHLTVLSE